MIVGISHVASLPTPRAGQLSRADFDQLVQDYQAPLLRFLTGLLHDPEVAADLCQDTFLSAYRAAPRLHGDELNVGGWLYTIALNHARGVLRRRRILSWVPFVASRHDRPSATQDLARQVAQQDELQELLRQLPIEQRACLLLHADGFRYAEIAQVLNCSVGAVKLRIFRAREHCLAMRRREGENE
ncbi:MAG: RNA polymerase sigma factor [Chloroflexi bacterium]|nr:RNA polymerase sigma factor [Chloroflexota bacterium]